MMTRYLRGALVAALLVLPALAYASPKFDLKEFFLELPVLGPAVDFVIQDAVYYQKLESVGGGESRRARLVVLAEPDGALVRIMNIAPKYKPGIELRPGNYVISVTKKGYQPYRETINLNASTYWIPVKLALNVAEK